MAGHRGLLVWQRAMQLVLSIYRATQAFPNHELYGLVSQLRRAAVSVPSNLAEGYGRNSPRELHNFIGTARGSLAEVETQLKLHAILDTSTQFALPNCFRPRQKSEECLLD